MTMINVVDGGDTSFNALFFPRQNPTNMNFIQQNMQNVAQKLSGFGRNLFQQTVERTAALFDINEIARVTRHLVTTAKDFFFDPNKIIPLTQLDELQTASFQMQRWIMAEPTIRQTYLNQQIDGYSDTYVNVFGKAVGEDHYDYCRVMDGVVLPNNETHYVKFYANSEDSMDQILTHFDKCDILDTWDFAKWYLDLGLDPTNPYG